MAIFIYSELLLVTIIGALITFEMLYKVKKKRKDWLVGLNSFIRSSIHCAIEFFNCRRWNNVYLDCSKLIDSIFKFY